MHHGMEDGGDESSTVDSGGRTVKGTQALSPVELWNMNPVTEILNGRQGSAVGLWVGYPSSS